MTLVITEKPSVAADIASVIGANEKKDGYYSGDKYYVTWCVGHLVQPMTPDEFDPNLKKWSLDTLPIIPSPWRYKIMDKTKTQFDVIKHLMEQNDVSDLICATDAGREGELIFRLVYQQAGCKKPFRRLWISSMEESAILDGFKSLQNGHNYDNLYYAALARQKADYLIGINASRLFSILYNCKLSVGRVQSPTLKFIVDRWAAIRDFVPQPYYIVVADCGSFKATTRIEDANIANDILARCNGKNAYISTIKVEARSENPPRLYDLTSLQQDANRTLGFTAQQTLDLAQSLYEKKLLTYPRTDSCYLTDDMELTATELIITLADRLNIGYDVSKISVGQLINNSKVSDHHAIIPTRQIMMCDIISTLPNSEQQLLMLVTYRLLTAAYTPYRYKQTDIVIDIDGEAFKASGKQVIDFGFKEFLKTPDDDSDDDNVEQILPALTEGQLFTDVALSSISKYTKPPKPYTEATLLAAMAAAGSQIHDVTLKNAIKGCGLGTPATRAAIIEQLIKQKYIERKNKNLVPTQEGITLISKLPEILTSPILTADWELRLEKISKGEESADTFISDITAYITSLTEDMKLVDIDTEAFKPPQKESIGKCPRCGKNVLEGKKNYYCEGGRECGFAIWKEDNFFKERDVVPTKKFVGDLLKKGSAELSGIKSIQKGTRYTATITMVDTGKYVNFKLVF